MNGHLAEKPPGRIGATLHVHLGSHALADGLGYVYLPDTGYVLSESPPTVRQPDISFIRADRLPDDDEDRILRIPPDLVVEVISPSDRTAAVLTKVGQWLDFGVPAVWLVAPRAETVTVFHPKNEPLTLAGDDLLTDEDRLPGFALPVRAIFTRG